MNFQATENISISYVTTCHNGNLIGMSHRNFTQISQLSEDTANKYKKALQLIKICYHLRDAEEFSNFLHVLLKYVASYKLAELTEDLDCVYNELSSNSNVVYKCK